MLNRLVQLAKTQCQHSILLTLWAVDCALDLGDFISRHSGLTVKYLLKTNVAIASYCVGVSHKRECLHGSFNHIVLIG